MNDVKGYVARGRKRGGGAGIASGVCLTADDALAAAVTFREDGHTDVRILVVRADGAETPLPPYDDALAILEDQAARIRFLEERAGVADRETARLRAQKEGVARQRDELLAEIERLRGQREAFRDHLDLAYRSADAERLAWARLVRAEQAHHDQTDLLGERDDDAKGAYAEVVAARQALCDLGVDVGSQLGEGPAS